VPINRRCCTDEFREAKAIEVVRWIYTERNTETSTRYTAERKNVRKWLADPATHHSSADDRIDYTCKCTNLIDKSQTGRTASCYYLIFLPIQINKSRLTHQLLYKIRTWPKSHINVHQCFEH